MSNSSLIEFSEIEPLGVDYKREITPLCEHPSRARYLTA